MLPVSVLLMPSWPWPWPPGSGVAPPSSMLHHPKSPPWLAQQDHVGYAGHCPLII